MFNYKTADFFGVFFLPQQKNITKIILDQPECCLDKK